MKDAELNYAYICGAAYVHVYLDIYRCVKKLP